MLKPQKLHKGDTVAIMSPSWGGPSVFPHVYEAGLKTLEKLGLKIKEYPSARKDATFLAQNPEFRAQDINDAFADDAVKAIFVSIGGNDSVRILPFLNRDSIQKNPKIIMGYSDATTFLTYLNQWGLVTLYGPTVMAGLAQWENLSAAFREHITTLLFDNSQAYTYHPYEKYCNGYEDWSEKQNADQTKPFEKNDGWRWLQGEGIVEGKLFGGCIEVLEFMKSTKFWPAPDFWEGRILLLEASEDKPTPEQVKYMLRNYGMQGVFDKIAGLLFGRARDYSKEEKAQLDENILSIVKGEFQHPDLPIVSNVDFGHTDPQLIMPLGITMKIDCEGKKLQLTESIFAE